MQMVLRTTSSVEAYIANREWRMARLPACPLHPQGGCSLARHGSYPRVTPPGLRVARWYCPKGHRTFSLLPDFLSARLPGLLDTIEACVEVVQSARSMEAAADLVRGPEVTLPGAIRWLRRRVQAVHGGLSVIADLVPELLAPVHQAGLLQKLRRSLPTAVLACIPAPLGFGAGGQSRDVHNQHEMGPDQPAWPRYGCAFSPAGSSCDAKCLRQCQRQQSPPSTTCSASGGRTGAFKMLWPVVTSVGSSGSGSISIALD